MWTFNEKKKKAAFINALVSFPFVVGLYTSESVPIDYFYFLYKYDSIAVTDNSDDGFIDLVQLCIH
jgi:hypothetical protein